MYRLLIAEEGYRSGEVYERMDWPAYGFDSVATAGSFGEAMEKAILLQPHVVLIGMTLGERMGYELALQLRSLEPEPVCCLMVNHPDQQDLRRAMRSGCRDYLKRPPESAALREFLEWAVVTQLHGTSSVRRVKNPERDPVLDREYSSFGRVTNKVLLAVRTDFRHSLSLTAIAHSNNMSSKYLGRVFLKETGMRFTDYLMAYRMLEARRLILSTGEKISVVAGMVGYTQLNNFYTQFRRYFGISPSSLRNVHTTEEATL